MLPGIASKKVIMRDLYLSVQRYIRNILLRHAGVDWEAEPPVKSEYYAPPRLSRHKPGVNLDFVLRFIDAESLPPSRSYCAPVLPHSMGAEVFVTIDAATQQLLLTELDWTQARRSPLNTSIVTSLQLKLNSQGWIARCPSARAAIRAFSSSTMISAS